MSSGSRLKAAWLIYERCHSFVAPVDRPQPAAVLGLCSFGFLVRRITASPVPKTVDWLAWLCLGASGSEERRYWALMSGLRIVDVNVLMGSGRE